MGDVYAVTDRASGERFALKRLRDADGLLSDVVIAQFRREYELLTELSHPTIIRVHDYGLDGQVPYYTMELLDGTSLAEHGEVHWREACALLRDVASSLSVIHSRRLVHRDVTLRNIQRTRDGRCKLLDFGAVTAMGLAKELVGTPPYLPPEALTDSPLDGRADLFALGATLFHLLTGRHAYPAARIDELRHLWSSAPPFPHELRHEIPRALSQLTMALLSLDPLARPSTAAEVMDRLSGLSGLELSEPSAVRRAYLATPALVGRARALHQVSQFLGRGAEQRGGVLVIRGPGGVGRTRMLEACVTQARLAGLTVLQARGNDTQADYGMIRALAGSAPAHLIGQSGPGQELRTDMARNAVQRATRDWLIALASQRPVLLAIDDIDRADEPSVACLAALSDDLSACPLLIAVSEASDRQPHARAAVDWLRSMGTRVELSNLTRAQVLELLSSIFGAVPNVTVLADRLHAVSGGHPQWVMQLAEHLVECGAVRYEAGAFIVPPGLRLDDLPGTLQDALHARLASLSGPAAELAHTFMLEPELWCTLSELASLTGASAGDVELRLESVVAAGIVVRDGDRVGLKHRAFGRALLAHATPRARAEWHLRLARLFSDRGDAARSAQQSWFAGDRAAAATVLVEYCDAMSRGIRRDPSLLDRVIASLPPDFIGLLCQTIEAAGELGLSKYAEHCLRFACVRVGALTCDGREIPHLRTLLADLRIEAGLAAWEQLSHITDPARRLADALEDTRARHEHLPEQKRGLPVQEAIRVLALVVGHAAGIFTQSRDFELLDSIPSLVPLLPLSPALAVVEQQVRTVAHLMAGCAQQAAANYLHILEQLDGEAGRVMDPSGHRFIRFGSYYALGAMVADRGHRSALVWADKLETELLFAVPAWRVRMAYHRALGAMEEAERCRRQGELLRIANRPHEHYSAGAITAELYHYSATDDLLGVKRVVDELQSVAARFPGWQPALLLARGEYSRLRGHDGDALAHFEAALALCAPGRCGIWLAAAQAALGGLVTLGRLEQACALGRSWLKAAETADLRESAHGLLQGLAIVEARLGQGESATEHAERALRWVETLEASGTQAGVAHETRARVALLLGNRADFERYLALCARHFRAGSHPGLWARFERLLRDASETGVDFTNLAYEPSRAGVPVDATTLMARLRACNDVEQRAASVLETLSRHTGASGGALYLAEGDGMQLRAVRGGFCPRSNIDTEVQSPEQTVEAALSSAGDEYSSFLLTHRVDGQPVLVGTALLRLARDHRLELSNELLHLCAQLLLDTGDATPIPAA